MICCGTIRSNHPGFPNSLSPQTAEVRRGNLVASVWKDTKLVCFLSTQSNPVGDQTVNRKQHDGTVIQVPTVPAAISYNKNMGGVDLNDQQRNYYAMGRKSRKWWRSLLWFLVDVSIVNAHILETEAENHPTRPQLKLCVELAKTLVGEFSLRSLSVSEGLLTGGHWPVETSKGCCKRCLKRMRQSGAQWLVRLVRNAFAWSAFQITPRLICDSGAQFEFHDRCILHSNFVNLFLENQLALFRQ